MAVQTWGLLICFFDTGGHIHPWLKHLLLYIQGMRNLKAFAHVLPGAYHITEDQANSDLGCCTSESRRLCISVLFCKSKQTQMDRSNKNRIIEVSQFIPVRFLKSNNKMQHLIIWFYLKTL